MLLGAAAVWAIAAGPADVSAWAAAYDKPEVGAPVDAAGRQLTWGHLTLTLTSGQLHAVRVAGQPAGLYFKGVGKIRYVSTDPIESPIYRRNAERSSGYRVDYNGAIEDAISGALVYLSSGTPDLDASGPAPPQSVTAFEAHRARFANDVAPSCRQFMAQARLQPPAQPLVIAEIQAGRDDLFYSHDSLRTGEESIGTLRRVKRRVGPGGFGLMTSDQWRMLERLSRQPIGRRWLGAESVSWVMRKLDATLVNPRGNQLQVETRQVFEALRPVRVLDLFLTMNYQVDSSGDVRYALDSVQDASGRALQVARKWDDLLVQLPEQLEPGQTIELVFRMSGDVLYRPGGDNYWALTGGWYPTGNRALNSAFTYHATVKVLKPFTPFTSAATVRRWEEGGLACGEFSQPKPIGQADVLAGKYTTHVDAREGLTVRVSSYGLAKPGASKQIAQITHAFAAFYEPLLGKFPFPELEVLEINAEGFGMAPAGMIFITREAFNPMTDSLTQAYVKGVNARLAHEVAHAWWGHVVRPATMHDRWLAESLAEYYSALAMQQLRDKKDFNRMRDEWKDYAKPVRNAGSVYLAHMGTGDDQFDEYYGLLYAKGPLVLHALRQELGDQAFFTVFKSLLSSFPMKDATTADVIAITGLVTKKDYRPWFERYILGSEWPPEKND